jgi:hypothetical protein
MFNFKMKTDPFLTSQIKSCVCVQNKQTNSVAFVRERTIPTERPPLVGEVSANFFGYRVLRGQRNGSLRPYSRFSRPYVYVFRVE